MDTPEQAELRKHVAELRRAARLVGHDMSLKFDSWEESISNLPHMTAREAKYFAYAIEDDLINAKRQMAEDLRKVPGAVKDGLVTAGGAVAGGVTSAYVATRDTLLDAGHAAKEGSKNTFARLAGVNRKPMKEWQHP
jgi:hypothetical protein